METRGPHPPGNVKLRIEAVRGNPIIPHPHPPQPCAILGHNQPRAWCWQPEFVRGIEWGVKAVPLKSDSAFPVNCPSLITTL